VRSGGRGNVSLHRGIVVANKQVYKVFGGDVLGVKRGVKVEGT